MTNTEASRRGAGKDGGPSLSPEILPIHAMIEAEQKAFIEEKDDIKRAGYFCAYTPPELLSAGGLRHARLFKAGNAEVVSQGERYTQSVFCDFSKSCIGGFDRDGGDLFYKAVDKVYNFHTCASMKRASEVIERFVPTTLLNLPRNCGRNCRGRSSATRLSIFVMTSRRWPAGRFPMTMCMSKSSCSTRPGGC